MTPNNAFNPTSGTLRALGGLTRTLGVTLVSTLDAAQFRDWERHLPLLTVLKLEQEHG